MMGSQNEIAPVGSAGRDGEPSCREVTGKRIRLVLVEDDPIATLALRSRLLTRDDFEVVGHASSAEDALTIIGALRPDVVFVDAEMMESVGLDVTRMLTCQPMKPVIVIVAAGNNYALRAFDLGAADYLLKPICDDRLEIGLKRVKEQLAHRRSAERDVEMELAILPPRSRHGQIALGRIAVKDRRRTHVIELNDIEWVGAAGDYTELHVGGKTRLLREPISVLLRRLPSNVFCRIHRSFAVNIGRVSGFKSVGNQDLLVKLRDGTVLRASRTFSNELRNAIAQRCA